MSDPDERAREIEAQMTDDERFSLLVSVMGAGDLWPVRDERIPADTPMSAGYVRDSPPRGAALADERCRPGRHQPRLPSG